MATCRDDAKVELGIEERNFGQWLLVEMMSSYMSRYSLVFEKRKFGKWLSDEMMSIYMSRYSSVSKREKLDSDYLPSSNRDSFQDPNLENYVIFTIESQDMKFRDNCRDPSSITYKICSGLSSKIVATPGENPHKQGSTFPTLTKQLSVNKSFESVINGSNIISSILPIQVQFMSLTT